MTRGGDLRDALAVDAQKGMLGQQASLIVYADRRGGLAG
jgi:hypothetical protein